MAPRRKRTVLDDSDSDGEKSPKQRKTSLRSFFSPNAKPTAASAENAPLPTASAAADLPSPTDSIAADAASPTPARRTRSRAAAKTPTKAPPAKADTISSSPVTVSPFSRLLSNRQKDNKSPCASPGKKRAAAKAQQTDNKSKTADLVALFTKQAEKAQNSPPKKLATTKPTLPIAEEDFIIDDDDDDEIADSSAVVASYVGSRAQKRWKQLDSQRFSPMLPMSQASTFASQGLPSSSQKFKPPPRASNGTGGANGANGANGGHDRGNSSYGDDDLRPWTERFAPSNLDELAVHKKKVADVRRWLTDVLQGRIRQRLLILKGAAGTGKTTTVRLLAKDMGLDVLEWRNPTGAAAGGASSLGFASAAVQFNEFLNQGSRFTQLELDDAGSDSDNAGPARGVGQSNGSLADENEASGPARRKIIVIEEFPNTFMRSSSALTGFRDSVLQYLAANTPSPATFAQRPGFFDPEATAPVIMILSETLLTTTSASADSFTAHRLLGPEILRNPGTGVIEFNAIAPSLLAKALELIVQKEARRSGRRRTPGPLVLRRLGEVGDVRSAVSSLEFLCVKGDDDGDWGAKVAFTKGRKGPRDAALTRGERETLEMVSQREASLGVFHAVGKVVYNKREERPPAAGSEEAAAEVLPVFLAQHARPKRPLVAVDTLMDETGTDTHTFISALHENYALSCEQTGPQDPQSSVDYLNGCIEYLSESDLLCPTWDIFFGGRGTSRFSSTGRDSGSHVLRQDEMAFQVAVRGLLFSLPSPVKRSAGGGSFYQRSVGSAANGSGGSGGGDQFKMFYPMSLKLWRTREELEALIDMWSAKLLRGELTAQAVQAAAQAPQQAPASQAFRMNKFGRPVASSSATASQGGQQLAQRVASRDERSEETHKKKAKEDDGAGPVLLSLGSSARKEMILERLPYMALLARSKKKTYCSAYGSTAGGGLGLRDLERMASFHGIGGPATTEEDVAEADEDVPAEGAWATDRATDDGGPRAARRRGRRRVGDETGAADGQPTAGPTALLPMYKLTLSDDEIEEVD